MCDSGGGGERKEHHDLEGLPALWAAQRGTTAAAPALHPLQQAWIDVQVPHCGYCQNGMMIQAADLLATTKNPSEDQIRTAMNGHLCRCGTIRDPDRDPEGRGSDGKGGCITMTGLLHEKEFSRNSFLKGGGALIIGFSVAGGAFAGKASAKFPATPPTPAGFNPDLNQVDSWITINADETVVLKTSQIEVGNGITTGFLQVLAEELDADMSQMRYGMFNPASHTVVDTWVAGSTGGEGGSNAMSGTGPKVRNVGALARQALLGLASTSLGVPAANLTIDKGVISGGW